jgi:hypothetical protein
LFDQGKGNDPDGAWIRVSPNNPNIVEIAIKRSLIGNPNLYLVDMWTGHGNLDPSMFDFSDHYTHEQAGAADPGLPIFYPIKAVFELDNSCRMAVGFQPTGNEPGLCEVLAPPKPEGSTCQLSTPICQQQGYGSFDPATCTCIPVP